MEWSAFKDSIRHLSPADQERVRKAFEMAKDAHRGQQRKSGEPYFIHAVAVAHLLIDMGADADTIIAALLHDTVEDTPLTLAMIAKELDGEVASLINGVTKLDASKLEGHPTLEQEIETLRKIFTTMQQDVRIMVIKLADRMHNMKTIEHLKPERQLSLTQETQTVFVKIADRLSMRDFRDALEELCLGILEPDLLKKLVRLRGENEKNGKKVIETISHTLTKSHPTLAKKCTLHYETKSWGRLRAQLEAEGTAVTGVTSLTVAFSCKDVATCYEVFGALHQQWQRETLSFEDFINSPMINGYQGLHTTIITENGIRIRCKIRTEAMDRYAHKGITTKCFDSEAAGILDYLPWTRRIATLSADTADQSEQFWASLQSDILGDSITVHGPNDKTITLPKGSTALDGALYLFAEKALGVTSISIDGKEVSFFAPLEHAASLDMTIVNTPQVKLEWLEWVNTGYATAMIREALASGSRQKRAAIGKQLLQKAMTKQGLGYLKEFKEDQFLTGLRALGYAKFDAALVAIAEGRLKPSSAIAAMLYTREGKKAAKPTKQPCMVTFTLSALSLHDVADRFSFVTQKYGITLSNIQLAPVGDGRTKIVIHTLLSPEEEQTIINELSAADATAAEISVTPRTSVFHLLSGLFLVLFLWGLDPVFARFLISQHHLTPVDFTLLRFWSLAIALSVVTMLSRRRKLLQPVRIGNPLLWLSSVLLTLIALTTYAALEQGTATHYEILMTTSVLLIATAAGTLSSRKKLILWTLFGSTLLLLRNSTAWNPQSSLFTLLSLVCFSAFLAVSGRYLRQEHIARRRLEYYTAMLIISSILTLPLLVYASELIYDPLVVLQVTLFSTFFIGLPYYLYYEWAPRQEMGSIIPFAYVMLTVTFVGELLLTHEFDEYTLLAFGAMTAVSYFTEKR
ncbi:hypothetical protein COU80_01905 [Candidatus Peregrinibacteria bacterium CG10_big_fil_rev_8_21_14_0_10_55_24]|nr:MAG: hypothetical protein COU80_01905 [Candidatus Peregrinibacteria bacterium CG10_big_fil_rev_8_21_14_0_10_55_24]